MERLTETPKQTAQRIATKLKKAYPGTVFRITSKAYPSTVTVAYVDGPITEKVQDAIEEFRCVKFDYYTDCTEEIPGRIVGAQTILVQHPFSPERRAFLVSELEKMKEEFTCMSQLYMADRVLQAVGK